MEEVTDIEIKSPRKMKVSHWEIKSLLSLWVDPGGFGWVCFSFSIEVEGLNFFERMSP